MSGYNCHIHIFGNDDEMSQFAASSLAADVMQNPYAVIGTATGGTPEKAYILWGDSGVDASNIKLIQLDQYVAIGDEPTTLDTDYLAFVVEKIANRFPDGMRPLVKNIHVLNRAVAAQSVIESHLAEYGTQWRTKYPNDSGIIIEGNATGPLKRVGVECKNFSGILEENPRDTQVLGFGPGRHPHIAFNDYQTDPNMGVHLVRLYTDTRNANARYFGGDLNKVPKFALTQGPADILDARKLLTLASGENKAEAVRSTFLSGLSEPEVADASARNIRFHDNLVVALDMPAAKYIMRHLDDIKRDAEARDKSLKIEIY